MARETTAHKLSERIYDKVEKALAAKTGEKVIEIFLWWTGLVPWECGFPFPGSLASTLLGR